MPLISPEYIITTSYGLFSMTCYAYSMYIILRNWREFKSSFYVLYVTSSIINMVCYFNQMFIYRLPQHTCLNCTLAPFYESGTYFGMSIMSFWYTHFIFVQYMMILITSVNRFTMIFFPFTVERIWSWKFMTQMISACFILPVSVDYSLIGASAFFVYQQTVDNFEARSTGYENALFDRAAYFTALVTFVALIVNLASVIRLLLYKSTVTKKSEVNLLIMTLCNFSFQLLITLLLIMGNMLNDHNNRQSYISKIFKELESYLTDCLSLLSPIFLFISSSKLRHYIRKDIRQTSLSSTYNSK